jgi:hypothetical protein
MDEICSLYSKQEAVRQLFRFKHDRAGNLPPLPWNFPDYMAPVIRKGQDSERELIMARWGMPPGAGFGPARSPVLVLMKVVRPRVSRGTAIIASAPSIVSAKRTRGPEAHGKRLQRRAHARRPALGVTAYPQLAPAVVAGWAGPAAISFRRAAAAARAN